MGKEKARKSRPKEKGKGKKKGNGEGEYEELGGVGEFMGILYFLLNFPENLNCS